MTDSTWALALEHQNFAKWCVRQFLHAEKGLKTGIGDFKGPRALRRRITRHVLEDLDQEALIAIAKAAGSYDPTDKSGAQFLTYARPWVGKALQRATENLLSDMEKRPPGRPPGRPRKKKDKLQNIGLGEGEPHSSPEPPLELLETFSELMEEAARRPPLKAGPKASQTVNKLRTLEPTPEVSEAIETIEWLERQGEDVALCRRLTRLGREALKNPGLSEAQRSEIQAAIRAVDRHIRRLRSL